MTTSSITRWRLSAAMSVLLLGTVLGYVIVRGGGTAEFRLDQLTLVESALAAGVPAVGRDAAAETALQRVIGLNSSVRGLELMQARLSSKLTAIKNSDGSLVYSSTDAEDSWVFEYAGPPQNGFKNVKALVVVNAQTGEVDSAQILQWN